MCLSHASSQFMLALGLLLALMGLCGCGQQDADGWSLFASADQENLDTPSHLVSDDPGGPVAGPQIPASLEDAAREYRDWSGATNGASGLSHTEWHYTVQAVSPDAPELAEAFMRISLLEELKGQPPDTLTGLNQRIQNDIEESRAIFNAFGYYEGRVWSRIIQRGEETTRKSNRRAKVGSPHAEYSGQNSIGSRSASVEQNAPEPASTITSKRVIVQFNFRPGRRYTLGRSSVVIVDPDPRLAAGQSLPRYLAGSEAEARMAATGDPDAQSRIFRREEARADAITSLGDVGLAEGSPAIADDVLNAVEQIAEILRNRGYPFAEVAASRYVVDHEKLNLEADIQVLAGQYCYMGPMEIRGESKVSTTYLEAMRNWRVGERWNQRRLENFSNSLRQTGLFQAVNIKPAEEADQNGQRAVVVELAPADERTVSGAVKFNSDFGAGVQAGWTHRNYTGRGDRLTVEMPIWQDMQILFAEYRLPFFLDNTQDFVAQAAARNEDVDAYKITSLSAAAGLEKRFSRSLTGGLRVSAEAGDLETPDGITHEYTMLGLPGTVVYNRSNSLLDATDGFKVALMASPYTGYYNEYFTVLRNRLDTSVYLPFGSNDKLVLALRTSIGSVLGASSEEIPTTIRFYSGGGGSVRGYAYQSIGPRNDNLDPLGGASMTEASLETRFKIGEDWGLVAFVDGGMVYEESTPDFGNDLQWGAGIGLRYYTVIGPVRIDVATPLNPRDDDDNYQLYLSIGQSF